MKNFSSYSNFCNSWYNEAGFLCSKNGGTWAG